MEYGLKNFGVFSGDKNPIPSVSPVVIKKEEGSIVGPVNVGKAVCSDVLLHLLTGLRDLPQKGCLYLNNQKQIFNHRK